MDILVSVLVIIIKYLLIEPTFLSVYHPLFQSRVAYVTFRLIGSTEKPRGGELLGQTACYDICVAFFLILLCEYVAHYSWLGWGRLLVVLCAHDCACECMVFTHFDWLTRWWWAGKASSSPESPAPRMPGKVPYPFIRVVISRTRFAVGLHPGAENRR